MHSYDGEGLGAVNARPFLFFLVFTEMPRRGLLGNRASGTQPSRKLKVHLINKYQKSYA
jgi:hypothetical protein